MIRLKGITFSYPASERTVFGGLDFTLEDGMKLGITGPNGSGKTTLFHIIMGLVRPAAGVVDVFGKERHDEEDFREVRRRVGLLFQDSDDQLFCPTVDEDIAFGPLNLGLSHDEAHLVVHETTALLGIESLEGRVTHRLSGGEKRLVALATVAAMRPDVLLLDEPTAGLDEVHSEMILRYLRDRARTYAVISHDAAFLREAADVVLRLDGGVLVKEGI